MFGSWALGVWFSGLWFRAQALGDLSAVPSKVRSFRLASASAALAL